MKGTRAVWRVGLSHVYMYVYMSGREMVWDTVYEGQPEPYVHINKMHIYTSGRQVVWDRVYEGAERQIWLTVSMCTVNSIYHKHANHASYTQLARTLYIGLARTIYGYIRRYIYTAVYLLKPPYRYPYPYKWVYTGPYITAYKPYIYGIFNVFAVGVQGSIPSNSSLFCSFWSSSFLAPLLTELFLCFPFLLMYMFMH